MFSPVANYTLPILDRAGHEYVGLLELLEPLGRVSSQTNGRNLTIHYNSINADFVAGKTRVRIANRDFDFPVPFLIENSRGLVPVNSLNNFLPRFLGASVNFRETTRRLLVGPIGIQLSFQLDPSSPPKLAINFSAPVNPTISTEPGKLRLDFKRDAVVSPGSQSISFDNKIITQAVYSESNGDAELVVAANQPLLATFANNRRTIVIAPIAAGAAQVASANGTDAAQNKGGYALPNSATSSPQTNSASVPRRPLAIVDPAHGGEERGAALTAALAEKDVTLGFARLLRHELDIRGFAVALTREGDSSISLDQRAALANTGRAAIYIGLHAVSQGNGAHVYTALLPLAGKSQGDFYAWNAAQSASLPASRLVAAAIIAELRKREFSAGGFPASLRPLNNVFMPAVAVELAPGPEGIADLTSPNYEQRAAAAIADAVASLRDRLGTQLGEQPGKQQ